MLFLSIEKVLKNDIMKKVLILSAIALFSFGLVAQDEVKYNTMKTEVNIAVANIFAKDSYYPVYYYINGIEYLWFDYDYLKVYRSPEAIIGAKFHNPKGAIRLSASLNHRNYKTEEKGNSNNYSFNIKHSGFRINAGYEWNKTIGRLVIYYGFDLSYSHMNLYSKSEAESGSITENKINQNTFGVNPLLGTNIFIFPNLSVGTEFKFFNEYLYGNIKNDYTTSYNTNTDDEDFTGFNSYFGPVGFISVNLYF